WRRAGGGQDNGASARRTHLQVRRASRHLHHARARSHLVRGPEQDRSQLDDNGNPMSVRGGIADILMAVKEGPMLLAYSGGLHHVQIPDHTMVRLFQTVRMRTEIVEIDSYIEEQMAKGGEEQFKRNVREELDRRRDLYCPVSAETVGPPKGTAQTQSA